MSLLNEIQCDLLNDSIKTSSILRKAYILARKLGDDNFLAWVDNELNGYDWSKIGDIKNFPEYRRPGGHLQGLGPYNITKPVELHDPKVHEKVCRPPIILSIFEIEAAAGEGASNNPIRMSVAPQTSEILCRVIGTELIFSLSYAKSSFQGIIAAVRNRLLKIILDIMENTSDVENGKLTVTEKQQLSKNIVQIINNPQGCQITAEQFTSYNFEEFKGIITSMLIKEGVAEENIAKLKNILDETNKECPPGRDKGLPTKILDFVKENRSWLTETVVGIINKIWLKI